MFDKLFALVGPTWSAVALLALVLAYFAVAASETARVAQVGEPEAPWSRRLKQRWESLRVAVARKPKPPTTPLPSSPFNSSPLN